MKRAFIDTNLIVYANDRRDAAKQRLAAATIADLMRAGTGVVSTQVLQEFASVAIAKLRQDDAVVLRILRLLETFTVVLATPAIIRRAVEIHTIYRLGFWDAQIVAAAEEAGCDMLLSEDFNTGQYYGGIRAVNPFSTVAAS